MVCIADDIRMTINVDSNIPPCVIAAPDVKIQSLFHPSVRKIITSVRGLGFPVHLKDYAAERYI